MDETTEHHGPDDRVQPRTVTTTGEHADSHPLMIGTTWVRPCPSTCETLAPLWIALERRVTSGVLPRRPTPPAPDCPSRAGARQSAHGKHVSAGVPHPSGDQSPPPATATGWVGHASRHMLAVC